MSNTIVSFIPVFALTDQEGKLFKPLAYTKTFAIAASAEEAYRHAEARRPDVVLMDIRIQGAFDGVHAAETLIAAHGCAVIYLTAHADEETIARAKKTGPFGYLLKPIKTAELRGAVEIAVYRLDAERRLRERTAQLEILNRDLEAFNASLSHEVRGPLMRDLLKAAGVDGTHAAAVALDKYEVEIPMADFSTLDVIAAIEMDGKRLTVRSKGPAWIIYPTGEHTELQKDPVYEARSIWQLKDLVVK